MPPESPRSNRAYPTAKPARPRLAVVPVDAAIEEEIEEPWLTREGLKGWASSLALHALLLLCLAFWYFAPKVNLPKTFDTRLAVAGRGDEEGLRNTGGLKTTLTIPEVPAPTPAMADPVLASLKPLEIQPL